MARLDTEIPEVKINVSNRTIIRIAVAAILAVIFYAAVRHSAHTLTIIGVALFLSLALDGPVHRVSELLPGNVRGNRGLATGISIGLVLVLFIGFLWLIVPPLVQQTGTFLKEAPSLVNQVYDQNSSLGVFVRDHHLESEVNKLSQQLSDRVGNIGGTAVSTITHIGSSLFATLAVVALTVMMLAEGPRWGRILNQLIPARHAKRTHRLTQDMQSVIRGYVNGQVLLAAIASVLIMPMLFILHISNPLALVVIIFVCGLIPMVGHTFGALIVTTVALFHSVTSAVVILAYYILYQQIENYVVQPRIQANATNMSALLVFISVLLGANFGGLLGALVAIPVMGCIRVVLLDYLESRDILSRKTVEAEKDQPKVA
jgi:predicted PurR-regulated permease PerM